MIKRLGIFKKSIVSILTCSLVVANFGIVLPSSTVLAASSSSTTSTVDGTTGTPLGGFGTGGIKFNAINGTFAAITQAPADQNDYKSMGDTKFQFFSKRGDSIQTVDAMKAYSNNGRYDDDAIWPEHMANLGSVNDIQLELKAFAPLDNVNYDNMSMPYAFYEMTVKNNAATEAIASCAFQVETADVPAYVAGKGLKASKWSVYAKSSDSSAVISVGSDDGFFTNGQCNNTPNGTKNKVAAKVKLAANETKSIKFVLAWYDNTDPDRNYYLGLYNNSGDIADRGLSNFDTLKENADKLVTNMRNSNLPDWLKNQTLNTLVNLTNNSMYKKDGRVGFAEGEWTCFGTMDQMWHARQIVNQLVPFYAWQELRYWASTQKSSGQIHHDFNYTNPSGTTVDKSILATWDDTEHADYRDVDKWVDLNCAFIISVYETYQTTNDQAQLDYLWPYVKKAAQRVLDQVEAYGNKTYPYTFDSSQNSYDAGGDPNPFNASLSAVAYKIMTKLAQEKGETALVGTYQTAYNTVVDSYRARYLSNNFQATRVCESYFGGQWLAMNLKLGEIWSAADTDYVLSKLDSYYHPYYWGMGTIYGTYNEWTPYLLTHYGGLLLNTRRSNQWAVMQKDAYNRQYNDRKYVFNHPLDILPSTTTPNYASTTISGDKQYISMPALWRNYYDIVGYHRDNHTKEIWVEPIILDEMNHEMKDAMFVSPEGYGSISCIESGTYYQNKDITIKADKPIQVNSIHLTDNFGTNVTVTINGQNCTFTRSGEGYTKELLVNWNGTIDSNGIHIITSGDAGTPPPAAPTAPTAGPDTQVTTNVSAYNYVEAEGATEMAGVRTVTPVGGLWYVTDTNNFDYIKFDNVIFDGEGSKTFAANVASTVDGSSIEVVLDSVSGDVIGTLQVPNTGGDSIWKEVSCPITKVTGTHNVILRFKGNSTNNLMNIDKFKFLPDDGRLLRTGWVASAYKNSGSAKAFLDGDATTNWHGTYQAVGDWIMIDMLQNQTFNKITFLNKPTDYPNGYDVFVSTDGTNFGKSIASGVGSANSTNTTEITFDSQTARYIKLVLTKSDPKHYLTIYEANVFNTKVEDIDTSALNNGIKAAEAELTNTKEGTTDGTYTAEVRNTLDAAIKIAKAVLVKTDVTQTEVDTAALEITTALNTYKNSVIVSKGFAVKTTFNLSNLQANIILDAKTTVTNNNGSEQSVLVIAGLYDANEQMVNVSYISKKIALGETECLNSGFKLPADITNYKVRVFVWDGTSLTDTTMQPVSNIVTMK
jgi:uncharacterized protein (DUF608 family)